MPGLNRKAHWQQIYAEKSPTEVSWFQTEPVLSLKFIEHCQLDVSDPVIDVGGGASVLVDRLLARGFSSVAVLDISATALTASRQRLGAAAERVEWIEADITRFAPQRRFALWHDRAVFHFLTDPDDRRRYVAALKTALRPGGYVIIAPFAVGGPERCSGLPIVQYDAGKIRAELGPEFRLMEEQAERHQTPAARVQAFSYFRLQRVTPDGDDITRGSK